MKKNWMLFLFFAAISVFTSAHVVMTTMILPMHRQYPILSGKHLIPNIHKPGLWNGK